MPERRSSLERIIAEDLDAGAGAASDGATSKGAASEGAVSEGVGGQEGNPGAQGGAPKLPTPFKPRMRIVRSPTR